MKREEKSNLISALQSSLQDANGVFVVENHGLTVKEMESLRAQRDALVQKILDEEAAKKNQPVAAAPASSSAKQVPASSAATAPATVPASSATAAKDVSACKPDTVFVRDTVVIHDTLYVIVAGKPGESAAPAQASTQPADSAAVPQADQTSK